MENATKRILRRHGVDMSDPTKTYIWHWGYGYETYPCEGKAAYCGYMDMYWRMHDRTMQYSFILWYVIAGIVVATAVARYLLRRPPAGKAKGDEEAGGQHGHGAVYRATRATLAWLRSHLLARVWRRMSGVQLLLLTMVISYLTIFTFVGGEYKKIYYDGPKTRTFLGPWANRVGVLAFALTPLTLMLSTRENIFSLLTGIPYQHFHFLHAWLGRIILVQSLLHTIGWTIIQGRLYEPDTQPHYLWKQWRERYYYMGFFAQIWIAFLWIGTLRRVVTFLGYELFRKSHYLMGLLFIGGCWGHWPEMKEWMIASLAVFAFDRTLRLLRTALLHFNLKSATSGLGFRAATAKITRFTDADGATVLTLHLTTRTPCPPGCHTFLTFPSLSIFQAHPFTPALATPSTTAPGCYEHTYLILALAGETRRLAALPDPELPVIVTGPYGGRVLDPAAEHVLLVAGGTGVSFTLPLVRAAAESPGVRSLVFVLVVRREENLRWVGAELEGVLAEARGRGVAVETRFFVTREETRKGDALGEKEVAVAVGGEVEYGRPRVAEVVREWVRAGRGQVLGSGPDGLGWDLRSAVAEVNDAREVWGGGVGDVGFYWDGRYH